MHRLLPRLAGLFTLILTVGTVPRPALASPDLTSLADRVFLLVNQQRAARGLPRLTRVSPLDRSAQDFAVAMATVDFFSHIAPDGMTPAGRMLADGYSWSGWGENIGAGLDSAEKIMDAWMQSPGHAANILSDSYTQIGIGVAVGGTYGIYWVEDFGNPIGTAPGPWLPQLNQLSATSGQPGDLLTVQGVNLGSPGSVTFGGTPAAIEQWTTHSVSVRIPAGAAGPVVLTNAYGSSNGLAFGAPAPPVTATPGTIPTPTPPSSPSHTPTVPTTVTPMPPTPTPPIVAQPGSTGTPTPTPPASPTPGATPPSDPSLTPLLQWRSTPPATDLRMNEALPNRGPSGTMVRLTGTGFGTAAGQVKVDGGQATVLSWSDTEIDIRIGGTTAGRKGIWILRKDGHASPIRSFRLTH